jgi:hypothetical protein
MSKLAQFALRISRIEELEQQLQILKSQTKRKTFLIKERK